MNRAEYMARLEVLLKGVSTVERQEAIQYYNDYFDDAGVENEAYVMKELESPEKLATMIKAGLRGQDDDSSEFRETGFTDTRFEEKEMPARRGAAEHNEDDGYEEEKSTGYNPNYQGEKKRNVWKIIAIVFLAIFLVPIVVPLGIALAATAFGLLLGAFGLFFGLLIGAAAIAVGGIVSVVAGFIHIFYMPAAGLAITGIGLLLLAFGLVCTALMVKVCIVVLPGIFRFLVDICRKPFYKKEKKA